MGRREGQRETVYDLFDHHFPGKEGFYTELSLFHKTGEMLRLSTWKRKVMEEISEALAKARLAKVRRSSDCGFCSSLNVVPPFCLLPPPGVHPPGTRQHHGDDQAQCVLQTAFPRERTLSVEKINLILANQKGDLRMLQDTNCCGKRIQNLDEYRSKLWRFAHAAGAQRTLQLIHSTCDSLGLESEPRMQGHEDEGGAAAPPSYLDYDITSLLHSVHESNTDTEEAVLPEMQRSQSQLVILHRRIFGADYCDYVLAVLIDLIDSSPEDIQGRTEPPVAWLVESAKQLHAKYPPDRYQEGDKTYFANRNLTLPVKLLMEWQSHIDKQCSSDLHASPQRQAVPIPRRDPSSAMSFAAIPRGRICLLLFLLILCAAKLYPEVSDWRGRIGKAGQGCRLPPKHT